LFEDFGDNVNLRKDIQQQLENLPGDVKFDSHFVGILMDQIFSRDEMFNCTPSGRKGKNATAAPQFDMSRLNFLTGELIKVKLF
jgi:hypothetical protein